MQFNNHESTSGIFHNSIVSLISKAVFLRKSVVFEKINFDVFSGIDYIMNAAMQDEQNDQCLSNFGAPDQCLKDTEPQNTPSNIPLLDGHDNDTSVCSTSVSYSVQFTIDELRRRRKHSFIVSHENRVHCSEKTAR